MLFNLFSCIHSNKFDCYRQAHLLTEKRYRFLFYDTWNQPTGYQTFARVLFLITHQLILVLYRTSPSNMIYRLLTRQGNLFSLIVVMEASVFR